MNTDTQTAYRSLATHFYTTRFPEIPVSALDELDEFRIIGALLRAAPSTGLTTSGGCVMHWPWTRSSGALLDCAGDQSDAQPGYRSGLASQAQAGAQAENFR